MRAPRYLACGSSGLVRVRIIYITRRAIRGILLLHAASLPRSHQHIRWLGVRLQTPATICLHHHVSSWRPSIFIKQESRFISTKSIKPGLKWSFFSETTFYPYKLFCQREWLLNGSYNLHPKLVFDALHIMREKTAIPAPRRTWLILHKSRISHSLEISARAQT